jgi:hypothetical protein
MFLHLNAALMLIDRMVDSLRSPFGPACGCYFATLRFAFMARHFWQSPGWPAPPKVSKRSCLMHPGLAALTPSLLRGHAATGHPWPNAALGFGVLRRPTSCIHAVVAASCRSTHCATIPFGLLKGALSGRGWMGLARWRIGV